MEINLTREQLVRQWAVELAEQKNVSDLTPPADDLISEATKLANFVMNGANQNAAG